MSSNKSLKKKESAKNCNISRVPNKVENVSVVSDSLIYSNHFQGNSWIDIESCSKEKNWRKKCV